MQIDNRASNWTHVSSCSPTYESHFDKHIFALVFVKCIASFFYHPWDFSLTSSITFATRLIFLMIALFFSSVWKIYFLAPWVVLLAQLERSFPFAYIFSLKGNWILFRLKPVFCSSYIKTIYLICIANQLTGSPVSRALAWLLAPNNHKLKKIIGSKDWRTARTRLILTMVSMAKNELTNVFMSKIFNQIDNWLNYNQFRLASSISEFICEIYLTSV